MTLTIRKATARDQTLILALVRAERLNPHGLFWQNFSVAVQHDEIVGAAQIRPHTDGARELSSLVVVPSWRGRGVARQLIGALVAGIDTQLCVITGAQYARYYERWGFVPVRAMQAPSSVRRNFCLGQLAGGVQAVLTRRPINRLVVLVRG